MQKLAQFFLISFRVFERLTSSIGAKIIKFERYRDRSSRAPQTPRTGGEGKGRRVKTHRLTVESHVEKERTGSGLTSAKEEGMKRSKKRGDGGRVIRGRGVKHKSPCMCCLCEGVVFVREQDEGLGGKGRMGRIRKMGRGGEKGGR